MSPRFRFVPFLALLPIACSPPDTVETFPDAPVILVSIDTLRADHLGAYGYDVATSPAIDAFRRDAVLFETAIAHAPSTLASHASLFSSRLPPHHGASFARSSAVSPEVPLLAEVLHEDGYRTAAFHGGGQIAAIFGLARGFGVYESGPPRFSDTVEKGLAWLEPLAEEPFFLFLHTYEIHHPYSPDPTLLETLGHEYDGPLPDAISVELLQEMNRGEREWTEADRRHIVAAYDAEILSVDRSFGRLVDELRARGLYDRSLIVVTSDHGEEFGEHGKVGWHSHTLYDELLHVPLLVKLPGSRLAGTTVDEQVRLVDLAPTLLSLLGIEPPSSFAGTSLVPWMEGSAPRLLPALAELDHETRPRALRHRRLKLYDGRLFDLGSDPGERRDLAAERPEVARDLEALRDELVAAAPTARATTDATEEMSEETLRRLRALGYID